MGMERAFFIGGSWIGLGSSSSASSSPPRRTSHDVLPLLKRWRPRGTRNLIVFLKTQLALLSSERLTGCC